jgi:hypothetical protein
VDNIVNGTAANMLDLYTHGGVKWRKSRESGQLGNCVEAGLLDNGDIAVRNSRHPGGPALVFTRDEMAAFLAGAKDGQFDDLASVI